MSRSDIHEQIVSRDVFVTDTSAEKGSSFTNDIFLAWSWKPYINFTAYWVANLLMNITRRRYHQFLLRTTALSCRGALRAPMTLTAMLAVAGAPGSATHARQVEGQTKGSPWSFKLRVWRRANYPIPKNYCYETSRTMEEARPTLDCSVSKEVEEIVLDVNAPQNLVRHLLSWPKKEQREWQKINIPKNRI
jgi:hypothetical protein